MTNKAKYIKYSLLKEHYLSLFYTLLTCSDRAKESAMMGCLSVGLYSEEGRKNVEINAYKEMIQYIQGLKPKQYEQYLVKNIYEAKNLDKYYKICQDSNIDCMADVPESVEEWIQEQNIFFQENKLEVIKMLENNIKELTN